MEWEIGMRVRSTNDAVNDTASWHEDLHVGQAGTIVDVNPGGVGVNVDFDGFGHWWINEPGESLVPESDASAITTSPATTRLHLVVRVPLEPIGVDPLSLSTAILNAIAESGAGDEVVVSYEQH
jgi:hypothetical protein